MRRAGFTLIEGLLVIGIVGGLSAIAMPAYRDYQIKSDLLNATEQISQALARARLLAQGGSHGSAWGYSVPFNAIFAGTTFLTRDPSQDEIYSIPETIETSGLAEVSFSPLEGYPSATGTIILTSLRGERRTVSILIDRRGIAVNLEDKLTLCHCEASPPHTMRLPEAAWPAHRKHGDYLGPCHVPDPYDDCKNKKN